MHKQLSDFGGCFYLKSDSYSVKFAIMVKIASLMQQKYVFQRY